MLDILLKFSCGSVASLHQLKRVVEEEVATPHCLWQTPEATVLVFYKDLTNFELQHLNNEIFTSWLSVRVELEV